MAAVVLAAAAFGPRRTQLLRRARPREKHTGSGDGDEGRGCYSSEEELVRPAMGAAGTGVCVPLVAGGAAGSRYLLTT